MPWAGVLLVWLTFPGQASPLSQKAQTSADQSAKVKGWSDPLHYYERLPEALGKLPQPEFFEMLSAIVTRGAQGVNGGGWFHAGESRYGWDWLASKYPKGKEGRIRRKDFSGSNEQFDVLDRNRDGIITSSDLDWSDRSEFARLSMPSNMWFRMYDANSNGKLTREEWLQLFELASQGKDFLTPDDLRRLLPVMPPPRRDGEPPPRSQMPSRFTLLLGLFTSELGSPFAGPRINQPAPDFALKTFDGKRRISLSDSRHKKPVVLVFGNFT